MWQVGKKRERDSRELCVRAGSCAQPRPGQAINPHCASHRKAASLSPRDGTEGWTCVTHCEHGAGQQEGQQVPFAPWTVKTCLIPLTALCHPGLPPHLWPLPSPRGCQPFPAPQNARASVPGEPFRRTER